MLTVIVILLCIIALPYILGLALILLAAVGSLIYWLSCTASGLIVSGCTLVGIATFFHLVVGL